MRLNIIQYTHELDKLYNYKYGKLEWRSLLFKKKIKKKMTFKVSYKFP